MESRGINIEIVHKYSQGRKASSHKNTCGTNATDLPILFVFHEILLSATGVATRHCMMNGTWADPNLLKCESHQFYQIRLQVII